VFDGYGVSLPSFNDRSTVITTSELINVTIYGYISGLGYVDKKGVPGVHPEPPETIPIFFELRKSTDLDLNNSRLAEPSSRSIQFDLPTDNNFYNDNTVRPLSWLITLSTKDEYRRLKKSSSTSGDSVKTEEVEELLLCDRGTTNREKRLRYAYFPEVRTLAWCIELESFDTVSLLSSFIISSI